MRLRISCATRYPALIEKISQSLARLLPQNRVSVVRTRSKCVIVSVYSNHLETLLGWKASGGSKHHQSVQVPEWVREDPALSVCCLRGLIETDGTVYEDRGYPMVMYSTVIPTLAEQVHEIVRGLGFVPHMYKIQQRPANWLPKYQLRLSRNVRAFLELVSPLKA